MDLQLDVMSKAQAEAVNCAQRPHGIVSVTAPEETPAVLAVNIFTQGVLRLVFDDFSAAPALATQLALGRDPVLFSEQHAGMVVDFVLGELARGTRVFRVHCGAGISRSAGIAAALAKHFAGDDLRFFAQYVPNRLVYRVLLDALQRRLGTA